MENHATYMLLYTSHFIQVQDTFIMVNTLRKVEDHENHARWIYLTPVHNMGGQG